MLKFVLSAADKGTLNRYNHRTNTDLIRHATEEIVNTVGQRIRLHMLHGSETLSNKRLIQPVRDIIKGSYLEYVEEDSQMIYNELKTSKYVGYASILILVNAENEQANEILSEVLQNIKQNPCLKDKTKFILSGYNLSQYEKTYIHSCSRSLIKTYFQRNPNTGDRLLLIPGGRNRYRMELTDFDGLAQVFDRSLLLKDHQTFYDSNVDNTFFMQSFIRKPDDRVYNMRTLLTWLPNLGPISLNELFTDPQFGPNFVVHSSTAQELYFYNINPTLAIVVNNYHFEEDEEREGSDRDVQRIIRELKIAQIPFILIQDSNRQELLEIMSYIKEKNFYPLKSFLFFLMTHGDENNTICTYDGELDIIKDIVEPIQSNESLKDAEKLIVANNCRGPFDMEYDTVQDLEQLKLMPSTNIAGYLHDNTLLLFSVPEHLQSPRDRERGSPFIKIFCQLFRDIDLHTQDFSFFHHCIEQNLEKVFYYRELKKRADLVIANPHRNHNIMQARMSSQQMLQLIESIRCDFPTFQAQTQQGHLEFANTGEPHKMKSLFCIYGSVKKIKTSNEICFVEKYFSTDLDKDECNFEKSEKQTENSS